MKQQKFALLLAVTLITLTSAGCTMTRTNWRGNDTLPMTPTNPVVPDGVPDPIMPRNDLIPDVTDPIRDDIRSNSNNSNRNGNNSGLNGNNSRSNSNNVTPNNNISPNTTTPGNSTSTSGTNVR